MIDDTRIGQAAESSAIFSRLDRMVMWLWHVVAASTVAAILIGVTSWCQLLPPDRSRLGLGVCIISGALTHGLLMMTVGRPESWLWPLLPTAAMVAGVVLVLWSSARSGTAPPP